MSVAAITLSAPNSVPGFKLASQTSGTIRELQLAGLTPEQIKAAHAAARMAAQRAPAGQPNLGLIDISAGEGLDLLAHVREQQHSQCREALMSPA